MHHPTDRIAHTKAFVTPVVEHWLEREIAQWVHSMKDRSDDPSHHERMLLPRSYISLLVSGGRHLRKRRTITDVERKKGGNALFTVILHYIIRDYSDYERGNPFPPLH